MDYSTLKYLVSSLEDANASYDTKVSVLEKKKVTLVAASKELSLMINQSTSSVIDFYTKVLNGVLTDLTEGRIYAKVLFNIDSDTPKFEVTLVDNGVECDPKVSHGGGFLVLLGFILRICSIHLTDNRNILILDEPLGALSHDYVDLLVPLLKSLISDLGFQVIMISHNSNLQESNIKVVQV